MMPAPLPTLWIDVDDLARYLERESRPSGIQRVTFELCRALHGLDGGAGRVRFVRRRGGPGDWVTVEWDRLDAAFRLIANPPPGGAPSARPAPAPPIAATAPAAWRPDLGPLALQGRALLALARVPVLLWGHVAGRLRIRRHDRRRLRRAARLRADTAATLDEPGAKLADEAAPGDIFLVLGSPWSSRDYARTVRWARDERRMRFALLVYDLVPVRHPEWCDRGVINSFTEWHQSVLPLADQIFAISHATAADVTAWTAEQGLGLSRPVQPLPMGTGLGADVAADRGRDGSTRLAATRLAATRLPAPGSYVLFVSTLEARKNHALLFRAWRRLLAELPRARVPTLVFAGRVGWLVADLMQQLDNAAWLGGKIVLVRDPSDAELATLYRGCQFTVYPSLFEGWGLPVSESLALGKPCVMSDRTSLPEAGGDLGRYFDPENLDQTVATLRAVIEDPDALRAWQERVVREFRHVPWRDSAELLWRTLAALEPA